MAVDDARREDGRMQFGIRMDSRDKGSFNRADILIALEDEWNEQYSASKLHLVPTAG
jgi:hypothetical protein